MRKPVVETEKEVLETYDAYTKENKYTDGIGEHLESLGLNSDYCFILYHYANKFRELGMWDKVYKEKWPLQKQISYLEKTKEESRYMKRNE